MSGTAGKGQRMVRTRVAVRRGLLAVVVTFAAFADLAAQSDPRLAAAVRQAQEGQGDAARTAVQKLLAATPVSDTLYPQVVYAQAMVANNAQDMRRHLQRISVEFPTSSWADDALLRLVQLDYATGNLTGAARNLERLRLDYPQSPLFPQAAYWAGQTYFDLKNAASACRWLAEGIEHARNDVEVRNRLEYQRQRCRTAAPPANVATDTGKPAAPAQPAARPAAPPAQPTEAKYRVQIAAVSTQAAAESATRDVEALGLSAVTVREGGLYKVRAGAFATRAEAQAAAVRIKARLGGNPFLVGED